MMGNPDTLTERNVDKLARLGVLSFQLSLDGLRDTHDSVRGAGSFDLTVKKISLLRTRDLGVNVMFTLFRENAQDLVPLLEHVAANTEATSFSFDIGAMAGAAVDNALHELAPQEIAELFDAYDQRRSVLQRSDFRVHQKNNLHRLQRYARDELSPVVPGSCSRLAGCLAGWTGLCLLSNGAALACRRLPIVLGKMPEQTFEELFLGSELMKMLRRHEFYKDCGQCALYSVCRGCPATTYGSTGDPFATSPHCFRHEVKKPSNATTRLRTSPEMSASHEEESAFIKENRTFLERQGSYLHRRSFQDVFFPLVYEEGAAAEFKKDPSSYVLRGSHALDNDEIAWLMFYFSEAPIPIWYDIEAVERDLLYRRHESVQPMLTVDPEGIAIALRGKTITASLDAKKVVENLLSREVFTGAEVMKWDDGFDWPSVRSFLHTMLEELVICYADR
jgi:radical SAM protein with 4Fe4S-binding SPASM domain